MFYFSDIEGNFLFHNCGRFMNGKIRNMHDLNPKNTCTVNAVN